MMMLAHIDKKWAHGGDRMETGIGGILDRVWVRSSMMSSQPGSKLGQHVADRYLACPGLGWMVINKIIKL